jgi:hypothetical protein
MNGSVMANRNREDYSYRRVTYSIFVCYGTVVLPGSNFLLIDVLSDRIKNSFSKIEVLSNLFN